MTSERLNPGAVKNPIRPRMVQALLATLFLAFSIGAINSEAASPNTTDTTKFAERIMHSRAFETVMWSVPLMNYTAMRNGYKKGAGVGYNDVVYHSKVQTWELEIPTGNNTTPYVIAYWTVKDGPVVMEVPPGVVGPVDDAYFRWVTDVGFTGPDQGRGGKYLFVHEDDDGEVPEGYFVVQTPTYRHFLLMRAFVVDGDLRHGDHQAEAIETLRIPQLPARCA